jgi:hypothetical protein
MPQVFHRSFNVISRLTLALIVLLAGGAGYGAMVVARSYMTAVGETHSQPVPFSHEQHVNGLGIDCRFCHGSVDKSAFAGLPATKVCMNCHQQIWTAADMLKPVRDSYASNKSIEWERVHRVGDFVYFNHSAHVNKNVGCTTCHGQVNKMPLMWQKNTLLMEWCLECHREPEKFVRPQKDVYNWDYTPPLDQLDLGKKLVADNHIDTKRINTKINCSTCHR